MIDLMNSQILTANSQISSFDRTGNNLPANWEPLFNGRTVEFFPAVQIVEDFSALYPPQHLLELQ